MTIKFKNISFIKFKEDKDLKCIFKEIKKLLVIFITDI